MSGELTAALAGWITGAPSITPEARRAATTSVLDVLGCMFAGQDEPGARAARAVALAEAPAAGRCSAVGSSTMLTARDAALVNGLAGHALDYDDYDLVGSCHPSVVLVPALLALAERDGGRGRVLLDSYVVGYTVLQVLGRAMNPFHYAKGFHATGTVGAVGAAAAAAHFAGASLDVTTDALAIAASLAAGLRANFGTSAKPLHAGRAAATGVLAFDLASAGLDASHELFDMAAGYPGIYAPDALERLRANLAALTAAEFAPMVEPPSIKPFAACGGTHSAIDAAFELRRLVGGDLDRIADVAVRGPALTLRSVLIHHRPTTGLEAKFSMEGAVAIALLDGAAGAIEFGDESAQRPAVAALAQRITSIPDESLDPVLQATQDVPIVLTATVDGQPLELVRNYSPGTPHRPLTFDEVRTKFIANATTVLDAAAADELAALVEQLDALDAVGKVTRLLRRA